MEIQCAKFLVNGMTLIIRRDEGSMRVVANLYADEGMTNLVVSQSRSFEKLGRAPKSHCVSMAVAILGGAYGVVPGEQFVYLSYRGDRPDCPDYFIWNVVSNLLRFADTPLLG